jgi:hypothetical protein
MQALKLCLRFVAWQQKSHFAVESKSTIIVALCKTTSAAAPLPAAHFRLALFEVAQVDLLRILQAQLAWIIQGSALAADTLKHFDGP